MKSGWAVRGALILGGLILGVVIYLVALLGWGATASALLHRRATVPQPEQVLDAAGLPSLEQEVSVLLGDLSLGGTTTIPQESINRILRIGASQTEIPDGVILHDIHVDLEDGAATLSATITADLRIAPMGRNLNPQTTTVEGRIVSLPSADGLLVYPESISVGRLGIPSLFADTLAGRLEERGFIGPIELRDRRSFYVPYSAFSAVIPPAIVLEGLALREGFLLAEVRVEDSVRDQLLSEVAPLLKEQAPALRQAVAEAMGEGHPVSRSVSRLGDLAVATPRVPDKPTALLSYLENIVEATPPNAESFYPQLGEDLPAGTRVETGPVSYAECLLRDESILRIDEETTVLLRELPGSPEAPRGRFDLLSGRIRAKVAEVAGTDYSFSAAESVCGVRGTDLVLSLPEGEGAILTVLQGSVRISPPGEQERLVEENQMIQAGSRRPPVAISSDEHQSLQTEVTLRSSPADAQALREAWWLWQIVDEARELAATISAMDREAQRRLEQEVKARLDLQALRPRVEQILALPEIQQTLDEFGVEDPLAWLEEAS